MEIKPFLVTWEKRGNIPLLIELLNEKRIKKCINRDCTLKILNKYSTGFDSSMIATLTLMVPLMFNIHISLCTMNIFKMY